MNNMNLFPNGRLTGILTMVSLWAALGATGCKSDAEGQVNGGDDTSSDGPPGQGCAGLLQKYLECNVVYKGTLNCKPSEGQVDDCILQCALNADCADLKTDLCEDALSPTTEACRATCNDMMFTCANGQQVSMLAKCNIQVECADGSDEADCPEFQCANGQQSIYAKYQCDGTNDCDDNSDELNCPKFTCENGEQINPYQQCDMTVDCQDGSDETAECAHTKCAG